MASTPVFVPHDPAQAPTCSWRGVAVDPTRSFWPVPSLELVLSLMARYRFSVMRWRLCAGSACLLPVPGFPFDTGAGARPATPPTPRTGLVHAQPARDAMHAAPRTRLLLRCQHPPPCRLRGGTQYPPRPRALPPQPRTRTPLGGHARPGLVRPPRGSRPPRVRPIPFPGLVHRPAGGSAARGDRYSLTPRGQGTLAHTPRRRPANPALPRAKGHAAGGGPAHLAPPSGGGKGHPHANHPGDRPQARAIPHPPTDPLSGAHPAVGRRRAHGGRAPRRGAPHARDAAPRLARRRRAGDRGPPPT